MLLLVIVLQVPRRSLRLAVSGVPGVQAGGGGAAGDWAQAVYPAAIGRGGRFGQAGVPHHPPEGGVPLERVSGGEDAQQREGALRGAGGAQAAPEAAEVG